MEQDYFKIAADLMEKAAGSAVKTCYCGEALNADGLCGYCDDPSVPDADGPFCHNCGSAKTLDEMETEFYCYACYFSDSMKEERKADYFNA